MALCWPLLASTSSRSGRWEVSQRRMSFRRPWRRSGGSVKTNEIIGIWSNTYPLPATPTDQAMARRINKAHIGPQEWMIHFWAIGLLSKVMWNFTFLAWYKIHGACGYTHISSCWQSDRLSNKSWFLGNHKLTYQVIIERKMNETHPCLIQNFYIIPSIHLFNAETVSLIWWWWKTIIHYTAPFCGSVSVPSLSVDLFSWSYQRVCHPAAGHDTLPWIGCMDQPR